MGNFLNRIAEMFYFGTNEPQRILLLGLDAAGKTTVLYKVKLDETVLTIPTIGFNCEEIKVPNSNVTFTVWDVGGQEKLRPLWRHYYMNSSGLLFVLDSSDEVRISEAADELHGILSSPEMRNVPVVVMANKQDMPNAMKATEVIDKLSLAKLKHSGHDWIVHETVAIRGEGILESFMDMAKLSKEFIRNARK